MIVILKTINDCYLENHKSRSKIFTRDTYKASLECDIIYNNFTSWERRAVV